MVDDYLSSFGAKPQGPASPCHHHFQPVGVLGWFCDLGSSCQEKRSRDDACVFFAGQLINLFLDSSFHLHLYPHIQASNIHFCQRPPCGQISDRFATPSNIHYVCICLHMFFCVFFNPTHKTQKIPTFLWLLCCMSPLVFALRMPQLLSRPCNIYSSDCLGGGAAPLRSAEALQWDLWRDVCCGVSRSPLRFGRALSRPGHHTCYSNTFKNTKQIKTELRTSSMFPKLPLDSSPLVTCIKILFLCKVVLIYVVSWPVCIWQTFHPTWSYNWKTIGGLSKHIYHL